MKCTRFSISSISRYVASVVVICLTIMSRRMIMTRAYELTGNKVIIGSGMSGLWVARRLTEAGNIISLVYITQPLVLLVLHQHFWHCCQNRTDSRMQAYNLYPITLSFTLCLKKCTPLFAVLIILTSRRVTTSYKCNSSQDSIRNNMSNSIPNNNIYTCVYRSV